VGSAGGTQAAKNDDEGAPRVPGSTSDKDTRFGSGGSAAFGGGAGTASAGEQMPDLSGMLAALLPKDAEEEKGTGTNIMEFRAPASEKDPNTPLIPQDYSIFKHVSETYGRLHKEKRVGT
jgi:hypothetical protein